MIHSTDVTHMHIHTYTHTATDKDTVVCGHPHQFGVNVIGYGYS